jgi:hypothetical protein
VSRERIAGEVSKLRIEVEVANFYPSIAAGLSIPVYMVTQGVIHVAVTHAFLRSLARLDLAESRVKALADLPTSLAAESPDAPEPADAAAQP